MKRGIRNHPEREQTKLDLAEIEQKLINDRKLLVQKKAEASKAYHKLKKEKDREYRQGVPGYRKAVRSAVFTYIKKFFDLAEAPSEEEALGQKEAKVLAAALAIAKEQCAAQQEKVQALLNKDTSGFAKEEKEVYSLTLKNEKKLLLTAKKDLNAAKKKLKKYVSSYRKIIRLAPRHARFLEIKKALRARLDYHDSVVSAYKETRHSAHRKALKMLEEVGITEPEKRMKQYPFELSGGMLQRCMIAMALVERPDILIADEPTTALDVTIQAQILDLLKRLQKEYGMAIIIITHDLGVVAQICDKVNIMYAGRIVERGTVEEIFYNPQHEYTKGLLKSMPKLNQNGEKLEPIQGNPVDLFCLPKGCAFSSRCRKCMEICIEKYPAEVNYNESGHAAACWRMIKELHESGTIDVVNGAPEGKPFVYNGAIIAEAKKARGKDHGKR
ncbi:MAG: ATP-binding cassette domain-containing protein [Bacilli bacterium]|nr:ATP-binding cassette domain-containing protein [Bacilli bacterium]